MSLSVSKAVRSLTTDRTVLGAALRDIGAEHCADPRVCSEAPGEFLTIWIPAVVLSQVPGKHRETLLVICSNVTAH